MKARTITFVGVDAHIDPREKNEIYTNVVMRTACRFAARADEGIRPYGENAAPMKARTIMFVGVDAHIDP